MATDYLAAHGNFEPANSIAIGGWESNSAFGSLVQSTIGRDTVHVSDGAWGLRVDTPQLSSGQASIANCAAHGVFTVGKTYTLIADVWMPAGLGVTFHADMLYESTQYAPVSSVTGQFFTVYSQFVFSASNGNAFPCVKILGPSSKPVVWWIDRVRIYQGGKMIRSGSAWRPAAEQVKVGGYWFRDRAVPRAKVGGVWVP